MNRFLKIIMIITIISFFFGVTAKSRSNVEEKIYGDYSIEDEFASNSVLVILSNKKSRELNDYSVDYFSNLDIEEVNDLVIKKRNSLSNNINLYTYKRSEFGFNSDAVTTALPCSYYG